MSPGNVKITQIGTEQRRVFSENVLTSSKFKEAQILRGDLNTLSHNFSYVRALVS
jgi:hypothetical protein